MRGHRKQGGFTLPELLVVLCLIAVLLPFFTKCFLFAADQQKNRIAIEELQDNLMIAMEVISRDISRSSEVTAWSSDTITLRNAFQSEKTVTYSTGKDEQAKEHFYLLEGKILYCLESTQKTRQPMANFIDTLTISCLDCNGMPAKETEQICAVHLTITGTWKDRTLKQEQIVRLAGSAYI